MPRHGKKYEASLALINKNQAYEPKAAIDLAQQAHFAKFDETVEIHLRTGLDPRHADQQVRGTALLPHGLGKTVRILVFAEGEAAQLARQEGADFVGSDDLITQIQGGWTDFDVALAQRELMGKVGRLGRVLGPRGLMPNPRSGTVVEGDDLPRAIGEARQGRVEFRLDRTAIIHAPIGKASFDSQALLDNMATLVDAIQKAKPAGAKGLYIRTINISTSMGPGIKLDLSPTLSLTPP
jgi:large subunit ribosomal protein L1